jgi:glyoxylase-like metal-dependent hydrolase (beta-lactamase superfamily II)
MMATSLKKLKMMISDEVVIYPGHDEKSTMKYEKQNNPYFKNL